MTIVTYAIGVMIGAVLINYMIMQFTDADDE